MSQNTAELNVPPPGRQKRPGSYAGLSMSGRISSWLDDWVNPVVVKELRQAVRSKFIMSLINLLLVVQLTVVAIMLLSGSVTGTDFDTGREMFLVFHVILFIGTVVFVPFYVGVRYAAERAGQNVDLLYTTTIKPLAIVWGKFLSGAVVTGILFCTAAPFMVLTYMLRGIDVPTIVTVVVLDYLAVIAMLLIVLLAMSFAASLAARGAMLVVCLGLMVMVMTMQLSYAMSLVYGYVNWSPGVGWDFWIVHGVLVLALVLGGGMMLLMSAAMIGPPSANRALPLRLYATIVWVIALGVTLANCAAYQDQTPLQAWLMVMACMSAATLFISICERDTPGPRVQKMIPRVRLLRPLAFLFYSGSAGGVLWSLLMTVATLMVGYSLLLLNWTHWTGHVYSQEGLVRTFWGLVTFCAYLVAYALAAVVVTRYLLGGKLRTDATFAVGLGLMAMGCILPPLLMYMIQGDWEEGIFWRIANPVAAVFENDFDGMYRKQASQILVFSLVMAGLMFVVGLPWMLRQMAAFTPMAKLPEHETPSVPTDSPVMPNPASADSDTPQETTP